MISMQECLCLCFDRIGALLIPVALAVFDHLIRFFRLTYFWLFLPARMASDNELRNWVSDNLEAFLGAIEHQPRDSPLSP